MTGRVPGPGGPTRDPADRPPERDARGPDANAPGHSAPASPGERAEVLLDQAIDANSLYQLRASVAAHAVQAGLPQRRADDLVIAAHELAANVVRHGSGHGRLRLWRQGQTLHCQVTDHGFQQHADGNGRDGQQFPDPASALPRWRVSPGHGLWLVRQLADQTSLHPGPSGSAVTVSFAFGSAESIRPFALTVRPKGDGCTVIAIAGQLDIDSADELTTAVERVLAKDSAAQLIIDLRGLTSWDAFGLAGMLRASSKVDTGAGASLRLSNLPADLEHHLQGTGLAGFNQIR